VVLTEAQIVALEKAIADKGPGYGGAQDTRSVGTLKGVGRIPQQTVIDTSRKVGFAKR